MLIACGLGACGGGSASHSSAGSASAGSTVPNGEAHKSATQILADVEAELGRVHSFHIEGTSLDVHTGATSLIGDVAMPGRVRIAIRQGEKSAAFILVGGDAYLMANTAFWAAHVRSSRVVDLLANRWIRVPPPIVGADFGPFLAVSSGSKLARCLIGRHGSLSVAGTTSDGVQPVVILKDHAGVPGDSPGELYVTTTGLPLPVRAIQTGPKTPGGAPDRECGETSVHQDTTKSANIRLSRFNQPVQITAPQDAIILPGVSSSA